MWEVQVAELYDVAALPTAPALEELPPETTPPVNPSAKWSIQAHPRRRCVVGGSPSRVLSLLTPPVTGPRPPPGAPRCRVPARPGS